MNAKMKIVAAISAVMCVGVCLAGPGRHGGFGHRGGFGHHRAPIHRAPPPMRHHWHHGGYYHHRHHHYGPGIVAASVIGASVIGGVLYDALTPDPVVVAPSPVVVTPSPVVVQSPAPVVVQPQPVCQTQNVWVEGQYVDRVQANGTTVRTWVPGHYEQRTVQVQ